MTAGLLADFITGFPMTPATARLHLYGKAHDRTLGGRDVVYYNFDTADTDAAVMDGPSPSGIPR